MNSIYFQAKNARLTQTPDLAKPSFRGSLTVYPTTKIERFLIAMTIAVMPLESSIPAIAGFSFMFLLFAILAIYVAINRSRILGRTWIHPVFLAGYVLLFLCFFMELANRPSDYALIFQIAQMLMGAIILASLCRDRQALQAGIYGFLASGVWVSVFLFLTSYGALSGLTAVDFTEASHIRESVFARSGLSINLNTMAIVAAQGAAVGLASGLKSGSVKRRFLFFSLALLCFVGSFLPLSRSGVMIVALSCAAVLFAFGINARVIMASLLLGMALLILVPDAAFARLAFSTETRGGKMEARAQVYTAAVEHFSEYWLTGVGAGNFWGPWGLQSLWYFDAYREVIGPHNCFIAITVYWGVGALLAFILVLWQAYRCVPKRSGSDLLALGLIGISVSLFLMMFVSHLLYSKMFSSGLGLLVGSHLWVWPKARSSLLAYRNQRRFRPEFLSPQ